MVKLEDYIKMFDEMTEAVKKAGMSIEEDRVDATEYALGCIKKQEK